MCTVKYIYVLMEKFQWKRKSLIQKKKGHMLACGPWIKEREETTADTLSFLGGIGGPVFR